MSGLRYNLPLYDIRHLRVALARGWCVLKTESVSEYIGLVMRLQPDAAGVWQIVIDGTHPLPPIALVPLTLIVRLWRSEAGVLRGSVGLHGSPVWAPILSNTQLQELARAWLFGDRDSRE